jgi:hypothetical protein
LPKTVKGCKTQSKGGIVVVFYRFGWRMAMSSAPGETF